MSIDVNRSILTSDPLSLSFFGPPSSSVPLVGVTRQPYRPDGTGDESLTTFLCVRIRDLLGGGGVLPSVAPFNLASGIDAHSLPGRLCFQSDSKTAGIEPAW